MEARSGINNFPEGCSVAASSGKACGLLRCCFLFSLHSISNISSIKLNVIHGKIFIFIQVEIQYQSASPYYQASPVFMCRRTNSTLVRRYWIFTWWEKVELDNELHNLWIFSCSSPNEHKWMRREREISPQTALGMLTSKLGNKISFKNHATRIPTHSKWPLI